MSRRICVRFPPPRPARRAAADAVYYIRPHRSTAAKSASLSSRGPPTGCHRIQSIWNPVSVEAARRLPLSSSSSSSGGSGKGSSTSYKKKKACPSLSSPKSYKPWIGRYMHNPKHLHSGLCVAYIYYPHSSPWWH